MRLKSVLTTLFVTMMLVVGIDYTSFAATGHSMILGKINKANKVTVLKRTTAGPALQLATTSSSAAPLAVNGRGKVANLNADLVDGYDGSQMLNRALIYTKVISTGSVTTFTVTLNSVPAGKYLVTASAFIYANTTGNAVCHLRVPSTSAEIYEWFDANPGFVMPSMAGYVNVPTTQNLQFTCYNNASNATTWATLNQQPLVVTFSPLSQATTGSAARVAPPQGRIATR